MRLHLITYLKYDEAGNEIKYTVKEALDNGKEEENGQITFGEYNYKVWYAYTEKRCDNN